MRTYIAAVHLLLFHRHVLLLHRHLLICHLRRHLVALRRQICTLHPEIRMLLTHGHGGAARAAAGVLQPVFQLRPGLPCPVLCWLRNRMAALQVCL